MYDSHCYHNDECDSVTPNQTSSPNQFSMYTPPKLRKREQIALLVPTLFFPPVFFLSAGIIVIDQLRKANAKHV
jgi:hypothetical protein